MTGGAEESTMTSVKRDLGDECARWPSDYLPRGWTWLPFNEVFEDITHSTKKLPQSAYRKQGCFAVIDQGEQYVGGYTPDESLVHPGDPPFVVFGDHTRCVKYVDFKFVRGADGVKVLKPKPSIYPRYAFYALKAAALPDKGYSRHMKFLRRSLFPVAPPEEQRGIVAAIEEHFSHLDKVQTSLAVASERLGALYLALHQKLLSMHGRSVLLSHISDIRLGRQRSPQNHAGPRMRPYLRAANVTWDGLDLSDVNEMNFSDAETATFRLEPEDILVVEASGSRTEVGRVAIWNGELAECCFQNTLVRVRAHADVLPRFLYVVLSFAASIGAFGKAANGIGIHHLGAAKLAAWPIMLPNLDEQERIVNGYEAIQLTHARVRRSLERAIVRATTTRSAVLTRAFSPDQALGAR